MRRIKCSLLGLVPPARVYNVEAVKMQIESGTLPTLLGLPKGIPGYFLKGSSTKFSSSIASSEIGF